MDRLKNTYFQSKASAKGALNEITFIQKQYDVSMEALSVKLYNNFFNY